MGTIEGMEGIQTLVPDLNLDKDFFTTKELGEKLNLLTEKGSTNYLTAVIWKYDIQNNPQYYQHKKHQKLYSSFCYKFLKDKNLTLKDAKEFHKEYLERSK